MQTLRRNLGRALCAAGFLVGATYAHAEDTAKSKTDVGVRMDCFHDFNRARGSSQDCVNVSGLRLSHSQELSPKVSARLTLDPFGVPAAQYEDLPWRSQLPQNKDVSRLYPLDKYSLNWAPRNNLNIAIGSFTGNTGIPSSSGLATANSFNDTGWTQTAVSVDYGLNFLSGIHVKFSVGNGEGENGQNTDPQQYFGFNAEIAVIPGVTALFGISQDGNNMGSVEHDTLYGAKVGQSEQPWSALGFSTQRVLIGATLDGTLPAARGLTMGVAFQRAALSDLDKTGYSLRPLGADIQGVDAGQFLIEDPTNNQANVIRRQVYALNFAYRILDTGFVGADYTARQLTSTEVGAFQACKSVLANVCDKDGDPGNSLSQTAFTLGGGYDLADSLTLTLEYFKTYYDHLYNHFNFASKDDQNIDTWEAFAARIAYHW